MKTLKNQTLIYDDNCPLCCVYTKGFITAGMLDNNGKKPYNKLSIEEENFVDLTKATNEIALIDNENKTVLYGIDSLLKVIGHSFPWIAIIGNWKPVNFCIKKLYKFISYNRKVIIPSKIYPSIKLQCNPDFNYKYRFLYILLTIFITGKVLYNYSNLIPFLPKSFFYRELILAVGQLVFQSLFLVKFSKQNIINYWGNIMTVSLLGTILLTPLLLCNMTLNISQTIVYIWFTITVFIMFFEHLRRVRLLKMPLYLCYTWVLYRIIALYLIVKL